MANKITTLFDLDDKGFSKGLKTLRTDIANADGALAKMKVGASGVGSVLKENLAAAAIGAGTAVVAFGIQSANAFKDAALAAGDMSDATGIAVEDASRWISVAGDFELSGQAVEGALLKMNKALADGKPVFENYGVEVVKTKDGLIDANATFVNALSTIGAIEDPTMRAKAAQEAFGRSYSEVARLMEMDAGQLKDALMATQEEQVFDEEEVRKAKEYQAVMDQLGDVFVDLQMRVGELVVELAPAISDLATMADNVLSLTDKVGGLGEIIEWSTDQLNIFDNAASSWERMTGKNRSAVERLGGAVEGLVSWVPVLGEGMQSLNEKMFDGEVLMDGLAGYAKAYATEAVEAAGATETFTGTFETATDVARRYERAAADVADETERFRQAAIDANDALSVLKGNIDDRQAWRNMKGSLDDLKAAIADNDSTWDDLAAASDNATLSVANYIEGAGHIPDEVKTQFYLQLDQGKLDQVVAQVNALETTKTAEFQILVSTVVSDETKQLELRFNRDINGNGIIGRAGGGTIRPGSVYAVGDNPDGSWNRTTELLVPSAAGTVLSAADARAALAGAGGGHVTNVYITQQVTPAVNRAQLGREMVEMIQAAARQDGPVFVTVR